MSVKKPLPELLAPAGSMEALRAAVAAGADAVYLGGRAGSARASAKNFSLEEFPSAIKALHDGGAKAYLAVNTLRYDREFAPGKGGASPEILDLIALAEACGADAFIVQDLGLASLIRKYFPSARLHASTQASGHSPGAASLFASLGFSRMVAARELPKSELASLIKESPIEIEIFVHGALCSSHSGQCLFSQSFGGQRSANRGSCAGPCRLPYKPAGLSLKDLCLAGHIKEILDLGPASLKIEGRMKPPAYVYAVTSVYRRLLDERRNASPAELEALRGAFPRGGLTDAYFTGKTGPNMYLAASYGDAPAAVGTGSFPGASAEAEPSLPLPLYASPHPALPEEGSLPAPAEPPLVLDFASAASFGASAAFIASPAILGRVSRVYLPAWEFEGVNIPDALLPLAGVKLPQVCFAGERGALLRALDKARKMGIARALVSNAGHIADFAGAGLALEGGIGLNIVNSFALAEYAALGLGALTLSHELKGAQARDLRKSAEVWLPAYGRLPLMVSENCLIRNAGKCAGSARPHCPPLALTDRMGASFPVIPAFGCRSLLLNSVPLYLADKKASYTGAGFHGAALYFTTEGKSEVERVLSAYASPSDVPPIGKFTRGRYK